LAGFARLSEVSEVGSLELGRSMDYYHRFCNEDDRTWEKLWLDYASAPDSQSDLPRFPSAEIQQRVHGTTYARAMSGALALRHFTLRFVRRVLQTRVTPEMKVLDFGCGWGCVIRTFLKDFRTESLAGTDVDPELIELARQLLPEVSFTVNGARTPLDYPDATFDIVVANSVFSHLSERSYAFWIRELTRVLRPGRALVFTREPLH
jgi:SAM-dependent methyltransferase